MGLRFAFWGYFFPQVFVIQRPFRVAVLLVPPNQIFPWIISFKWFRPDDDTRIAPLARKLLTFPQQLAADATLTKRFGNKYFVQRQPVPIGKWVQRQKADLRIS